MTRANLGDAATAVAAADGADVATTAAVLATVTTLLGHFPTDTKGTRLNCVP